MLRPLQAPSAAKSALWSLFGAVLCLSYASAADTAKCLLADGFDFPCGKPEGSGYYKARGFWPNGHLGEDWNGNGGGDSDAGDPIYAIGRGVVVLSENVRVGWGNCVIVRHAFREVTGKIEMVDSLYGHLLERKVAVGQIVERGDLVGTMGGNSGMYPVHLHLEVRKNLGIGMNRSKFARDYSNYHSPTAFINAHRQIASDPRKFDIPLKGFAPYGEGQSEEDKAIAGANSSSSSFTSSTRTPGVTKTGRGLSIPVPKNGAVGPATPQVPPPPPQPGQVIVRPTTVITPPGGTSSGVIAPSGDSDFWNRLKTKLNNSGVTPGIEDKR